MQQSGSLARSGSDLSDFSDGGSVAEGARKPTRDEGEDHEGDETQEADIITGVWGVIYTVSREKKVPVAQVVFKLTLDALQLLLLTINPSYGWTIDSTAAWWNVVSFVQLNSFMSQMGLTFFLACLYVFVCLLLMTLGLCIWVALAFRSNRFDYVWPITFLRWFSNIFFQILDIASMTLFLMVVDCQYTNSDPNLRYYNQEFPSQECWSMPFMINVVVASFSVLLFVAMATVFQMGDMETNPTTHNPLAMGHSKVEVISFLMRFFLTACSVFVTNLRWLSICYVVGSFVLVYLYAKWVPHYVAWVNHVRTGTYSAVFYSAIVMACMEWATQVDVSDPDAVYQWQRRCTIVMVAGLVPAGLLAAGVSYLRLRYLTHVVVNKFRLAPPEHNIELVHTFQDEREVEVAARCLRKWVPAEDGSLKLDEASVALAEIIINVGASQFAGQAYIHILRSSFLADVQKCLQSSLVELSKAKKSKPNFLERFAIFSREQQQVQTDAHGTDLLSYVQLQRNLRLATKVFKASLASMGEFWHLLLKNEVKFEELIKCVQEVDLMIMNADNVYKEMLQSTVDSWKILKLYAKFLEAVKNDPFGASKWNAEADDMCRVEESAQQNMFSIGKDAQASAGVQAVSDDPRSAICINASGIITHANKASLSLFGCQTHDLIGKNVKVLMPPPFKEHHDQFIKSYVETGRARIMGKPTSVVAQHSDGHLFPVTILVNKIGGKGMDQSFIGLIEPMPPSATAKAWVMTDGTVLSVESSISSWFGYQPHEMVGGSIWRFVQDPAPIIQGIETMARDPDARRSIHLEGSGGSPSIEVPDMRVTHKYLQDPVVCSVNIGAGGTETQNFLILSFTRVSEPHPVLVTDSSGRTLHASQDMATALGLTHAELVNEGNLLTTLIPEPFAQLHAAYLTRAPDPSLHCVVPYSCRAGGLSMSLNVRGADGAVSLQPFQVTLHRTTSEEDRSTVHVIGMKKRSMEEALGERCLAVLVDMQGTVRKASAASPALFGFEPSLLVGRPIGCLLDAFSPDAGNAGSGCDVSDIMKALVQRTVNKPGSSYRLGVRHPLEADADDAKLHEAFFASIASQLRSTQKKAAVVRAALHCFNEELSRLYQEAAEAADLQPMFDRTALSELDPKLQGEFMVEMQIWKADLITGVLHLNERGVITSTCLSPLFPADLAFGSSRQLMLRQHISKFLPVEECQSVDALFEPMDGSGKAAGQAAKRGGMKMSKDFRQKPGAVNRLSTVHATDGERLQLQVQAVALRGSRAGIDLIVHLHQPVLGTTGFVRWLTQGKKVARAAPASLLPPPPAAPEDYADEAERLVQSESRRLELPFDGSALMKGTRNKKNKILHQKAAAEGGEERVTPQGPGTPEEEEAAAARGSGEAANAPSVPAKKKASRRGSPLSAGLEVSLDHLAQAPTLDDDPDAEGGQKEEEEDATTAALRHLNSGKQATTLAVAAAAAGAAPQGPRERVALWMQASMQASSKGREGGGAANAAGLEAGLMGRSESPRAAASASPCSAVRSLAVQRGLSGGKRVDEEAEAEDEFAEDNNAKDWPVGLRQHSASTVDISDGEDGGVNAGAGFGGLPASASVGGSSNASNSGAGGNDGQAADYKRGKRYKRLLRLLTGQAARQVINRFYAKAAATAFVVSAVTVACFVAAYMLILGQSTMVMSMEHIGFAANAMAKVAIEVNYLVILYGNNTEPWLYGLQSFADVQEHLDNLAENIETFKTLHQEAYSYVQSLPDTGSDALVNLHTLWDRPTLPLTTYLPASPTPTSEVANATLWDAGQSIINKALIVWQDTPYFPNNVVGATNYSQWYDVRYILDNTLDVLIPAYTSSMDYFLQVVIDQAQSVNAIHYYFLVLEGCITSVLALLVMLVITTQIVVYRWNVYNCFILVPSGVIRGMAARVVQMMEDDIEGKHEEQGTVPQGAKALLPEAPPPVLPQAQHKQPMSIADNGRGNVQDTTVLGILRGTFGSMQFWRRQGRVHPASHSRRTLVRSFRLIAWFMWPFGVWGLMMVAINSVAHAQLSLVASPIALFNLVNYNIVQFYRFHVFLQELTIEPDPTKMAGHRMYLAMHLPAMMSDYTAMLYGSAAVNDTSAHVIFVDQGLVGTSFGQQILFQTEDCLRVNQTSCLPPSNQLYGYTRHGLDALFNRYWEVLRIDLSDGGLAPWFNSAEFNYVDTTYPDIEGGLIQLCASYYSYVESVYQGVVKTHIVGLVITLLLMAFFGLFILLPFIRTCRAEGKRIAELLSQLPSDLDIEALVRKALMQGGGPSDGATATSLGPSHPSMTGESNKGPDAWPPSRRDREPSGNTVTGGFFRPSRGGNGAGEQGGAGAGGGGGSFDRKSKDSPPLAPQKRVASFAVVQDSPRQGAGAGGRGYGKKDSFGLGMFK